MEGVQSVELSRKECNCRAASKDKNGNCVYGGECRNLLCVYSVTFKDCGAEYIGSTMNTLKSRMYGHFRDIMDWFQSGKQTDTFAKHFVRHFKKKPSAAEVREKCQFRVLKMVNPFSYMKKVRSYECKLCMAEKVTIISRFKEWKRIINANSEIYGPCRHNSRFHRFQSTDERERGNTDEGDDEGDDEGSDEETGLTDGIPIIPLCWIIQDSEKRVIHL